MSSSVKPGGQVGQAPERPAEEKEPAGQVTQGVLPLKSWSIWPAGHRGHGPAVPGTEA